MIRLAHLGLLALVLFAHQATYAAWLDQVPAATEAAQNPRELSPDAFFEVPASKLAAAEFYLSKEASVEDPAAASYFGRPEFKCGPPSRVYLMRALYEN